MDVIDVPLVEPRPKSYQTENWLLNPDYYWEKKGRATWNHLDKLADPIAPLWSNGNSTYHGLNDRIDLPTAANTTSSLRLIHVGNLVLSAFAPGIAFGNLKRRVQARFRFGGIDYRLWVTDPIYERQYLAIPDAEHNLGESFLTVSIGEAAPDGFCYKLVAAMIERARELSA